MPDLPANSELQVFTLSRLDPEAAVTVLPFVFGAQVEFKSDPRHGEVTVRAASATLAAVEALLKALDAEPDKFEPSTITVPAATPANPKFPEMQLRFLQLQHLSAEQAGNVVASLRPWEPGVLFIKVPAHRALLEVFTSGAAEKLKRYEDQIKEFDVPAAAIAAGPSEQSTKPSLELIDLGGGTSDEILRRMRMGSAGRPGTAALLAELNTPPELIVNRVPFGTPPSSIPADSPMKVVALKRLDPAAAVNILQTNFRSWATFMTAPNRGVIARTSAENLSVVESLLKVLDGDPNGVADQTFTVSPPSDTNQGKPFEIRLFRLENLTAEQAGETIAKLYPWGSGVVLTKVPSHRALMASGAPELMENIATAVKELDQAAAASTASTGDEEATEPPEVVGPAAVGRFRRGGDEDEAPVTRGPLGAAAIDDDDASLARGRRGAAGFADEDDAASRFGGGRGAAGGRGMMVGGGRVIDPRTLPETVPLEMKVFTLQHLSGDDAMSVLNSLFEGSTTFSRVASQKTVIIANGPAQILQQIEALLKTLDAAPATGVEPIDPVTLSQYQLANFSDGDGQPAAFEMKLFRLAHMHPVNAVNALRPLFPGSGPMLGGGRAGRYFPAPTLIAVPSQRALIARGLAEDLKKIEALLKVLDVADVEPAAGAEAAAEATTEDDEKLPPNSFSMKYQLRDAKWRDVGMELMKLRRQSGVEWFRVDTNTVDNTVTVIGSSAGLQAPSGLIQKLDPNSQLVVTDNYPPTYNANGFAIEESAGDVEALRLAFAEHEAKVRDRAERGRDPARYLDGRPPQKIAEELRAAVVDAFDARQNLQRAELAALEQRLASMRRTLAAREKIKEQIVQRRIEELLNPALQWETSAKGKQSPANDANIIATSDWPVPFVHVKKATDESGGADVVHESPIKSPDELTERLYRGKTESEWRQNFKLETEPAAKLEAAAALVNLAVNDPPGTVFERIMDIEVELLQMSHPDKPLEFAFESYPTHYWSIGGDERRKAFMAYHQELQRIIAGLPQTLVAEQLAAAISGNSEPHAAAGTYLLNYIALPSIQADREAARRLFEHLHEAAFHPGSIASLMTLLGKYHVSTTATEAELAEVAQQVIETCRALREHPPESRKLAETSRDWLIAYMSTPPVLTKNEEVTRALAELLLDDVVVRGRNTARLVDPEPVWNDRVSHPASMSKWQWIRQAYGPTLRSWVAVANEYLAEHAAPPYSDADRAVCRGVLRASEVFSDGDDWPVEQTAEILTAQLRAAYTDDPSQTVDTPIDELLPAKPLAILSQIVAINGEIPEFIGTATPKSKAVVEKLATLDRYLAGTVADRTTADVIEELEGLLSEAPVETIGQVVKHAVNAPLALVKEDAYLQQLGSLLETLGSKGEPILSFGGLGGGGFDPVPAVKETIDPLLLLAILNDLTGSGEVLDQRIALLLRLKLKNGALGEQLRILLDSPLQSRKHAAQMLREMSAKTGSRELRDRLLIVDPTIAGLKTGPDQSQ